MKTHARFSACLIAVVSLTPFVLAEDAKPEIQAAFIDPASAEAKSYRVPGEYAIDRLVMTMVTDASRAVAGHTEVAALATFHLKDIPMKNGTVAGLPRISAVKLTSLKLRNPLNAPDAAEQLALEKVRREFEVGSPPSILVQRVQTAQGEEWRVYKPLATIRQCGTCHATPEEQSPELRAAIQQSYPSDQSSSYGTGQWRGLIRVTVAPPAPPPAAPKAPRPTKA